jgi:hypothetical protein
MLGNDSAQKDRAESVQGRAHLLLTPASKAIEQSRGNGSSTIGLSTMHLKEVRTGSERPARERFGMSMMVVGNGWW